MLAVLLFLPGLGGGFLFDDWPNIVRNPALHLKEINNLDDLLYAAYSFEVGGSSRPLAMLSFALDFWRAGLDPVAFKVTNLVIHGVTSFVLALFLRQVFMLANWSSKRAANMALLLALLWAIHPLQVSSVLYVVQRMQTLATLFVLLTLFSYVRMRALQIAGERGQLYGILAVLSGVLAFASKEDAALIPLYLLGLELTVLQFREAQRLRMVYGLLVLLGAAVYCFVVIPYFWHWDAYPGRDFSSVERLLTQGRVLVMYLWQIVLPYPSHLTFLYDTLPVSRSLWQPWTTVPAILLLGALLVWALYWRRARPVFSFGVLLFFAGHVMTSNIIGLELAFEHRNHLPSMGVLLALGDLLAVAFQRWRLTKGLIGAFVVSLVILVSSATLFRAYIWGDGLRLTQEHLRLEQDSERAWLMLCTTHFELSNQQKDRELHLDLAINTCQKGAEHLSQSTVLMHNVLIYRAVKGDEADDDWARFLLRLQNAPMNIQNKGILWVTLQNAEKGVLKNEKGILETIDIMAAKATLQPAEYLRLGAYVFNETHVPIRALAYLQKAVELSPPGDPVIQKMLGELVAAGRQDWVDRLIQVRQRSEEEEVL